MFAGLFSSLGFDVAWLCRVWEALLDIGSTHGFIFCICRMRNLLSVGSPSSSGVMPIEPSLIKKDT
jgi:hypothetical protein